MDSQDDYERWIAEREAEATDATTTTTALTPLLRLSKGGTYHWGGASFLLLLKEHTRYEHEAQPPCTGGNADSKQIVITRLATLNSALPLLELTHDKPARVTVEEVLVVARRLEEEAWRGLPHDHEETPHPPGEVLPSAPSPVVPPSPTHPNGPPPKLGDATERQVAAIFAIGKKKGYSAEAYTTARNARGGAETAAGMRQPFSPARGSGRSRLLQRPLVPPLCSFSLDVPTCGCYFIKNNGPIFSALTPTGQKPLRRHPSGFFIAQRRR
jgi:hypothetical protein